MRRLTDLAFMLKFLYGVDEFIEGELVGNG